MYDYCRQCEPFLSAASNASADLVDSCPICSLDTGGEGDV